MHDGDGHVILGVALFARLFLRAAGQAAKRQRQGKEYSCKFRFFHKFSSLKCFASPDSDMLFTYSTFLRHGEQLAFLLQMLGFLSTQMNARGAGALRGRMARSAGYAAGRIAVVLFEDLEKVAVILVPYLIGDLSDGSVR